MATTNRYMDMAIAVADMVAQKQLHYGNSVERTGQLLAALYPTGIPVDAYPQALLLVRMLDKMCRLAHGEGGETRLDAWRDLMGYALIGLDNSR